MDPTEYLTSLRAFQKACQDEMRALDEGLKTRAAPALLAEVPEGDTDPLTPFFLQERWNQLDEWESAAGTEADALKARLDRLDHFADIPAAREDEDEAKKRVNVNTKTDPFDFDDAPLERDARDADMLGRVLTYIEGSHAFFDDDAKEAATRTMERTAGVAAEQTLISEHPVYRTAFAKYMTDNRSEMDDNERAIMAEADAFLRGQRTGTNFFENDSSYLAQVAKYRALNVTDNVTGKLVPAHLDPSIVITNAGASNPFSAISRHESGTTNVWTGVSTAGVTIGWTGTDGTEVGDDSPSFSNPTVQAAMWDAFVPISIQAWQDWSGAEAGLAMIVADSYDRLLAQSLATGSGTNEPFGIVTVLAGTARQVNMATNTAFTLADLLSAKNALGRRYRQNAKWVGNEIYGDFVRQFGTALGSLYTVGLDADRPDRILGKDFLDSSGMTAVLDSATTNHSFVYGDFSNFLIYERVGTTMEFIPHLFHTGANRPSLTRGLLWFGRTGADSINDTGFVLLTNPKAT
jgi:HK97 family phage major capsid protein